MTYNSISVNPSTDPAAPNVAIDRIGGVDFQRVKIYWGAEGTANDTADTDATRFPTKDYAGHSVQTAQVANAANLSAEINLTGLRNWGFFVPASFDGTQIEFHISSTTGGTFGALYDITNTIVRMTVTAGRWYDSPGEVMWAQFMKINCVTAQTGTTDFIVVGKS